MPLATSTLLRSCITGHPDGARLSSRQAQERRQLLCSHARSKCTFAPNVSGVLSSRTVVTPIEFLVTSQWHYYGGSKTWHNLCTLRIRYLVGCVICAMRDFGKAVLPLSRLVMMLKYLVSGPPEGPSDAQRAFFLEIQKNYGSIWPEVERELVSEARKIDAPVDFRLVAVDIPVGSSIGNSTDWKLSYETGTPKWHFSVLMRAWRPQSVITEP